VEQLLWAFESLNFNAILDILLVASIVFAASLLVRGTTAMTLLRGMLFLFVAVVLLSNLLNLTALRWLLENIITLLAVAIPVIFQPELRRALERLGRAGIISRQPAENQRAQVIEAVATACERLSERRHGALIVLERNSSLDEYMRTGIPLHSDVSPQLLLTIFWPKTELHDGAVIIETSGRIAAAAAVLPLSSSRHVGGPKLGTRHRAALGMSEVSDAICVVVSEETGRITIANGGRLIPKLDGKRLRTVLNAFYGQPQNETASLLMKVREQFALLFNRQQRQKNLRS
jgi:diadenylate cyclase